MTLIPVSLATEGDLDEQVLPATAPTIQQTLRAWRLLWQARQGSFAAKCGSLQSCCQIYTIHHPGRLGQRGLSTRAIVNRWLPHGRNSNLILRIAVHEVEAWLMADREHLLAEFLGIPVAKIPQQTDDCNEPKLLLVNLARHSRKRHIREDLVPMPGSTSKVGRNYTGQLIRFAISAWRVDDAARRYSPSLDRAMNAV
jgi:hypothetical protein